MTPGERATRLALMVLKEVAGQTRHSNDEEAFALLMQQTKDAAAQAGVDVKDLYAAVMEQIDKHYPALAENLRHTVATLQTMH